MKQNTTYHSVLRVSSLVCAFVLMFESGLVSESTAKISMNTHLYVANTIGMSASVESTELSEFTAALTEKQTELEKREALLKEREISIGLSTGGTEPTNNTATYVLSSILFILLVLILLNYTLDYLRMKEREELQTV